MKHQQQQKPIEIAYGRSDPLGALKMSCEPRKPVPAPQCPLAQPPPSPDARHLHVGSSSDTVDAAHSSHPGRASVHRPATARDACRAKCAAPELPGPAPKMPPGYGCVGEGCTHTSGGSKDESQPDPRRDVWSWPWLDIVPTLSCPEPDRLTHRNPPPQ